MRIRLQISLLLFTVCLNSQLFSFGGTGDDNIAPVGQPGIIIDYPTPTSTPTAPSGPVTVNACAGTDATTATAAATYGPGQPCATSTRDAGCGHAKLPSGLNTYSFLTIQASASNGDRDQALTYFNQAESSVLTQYRTACTALGGSTVISSPRFVIDEQHAASAGGSWWISTGWTSRTICCMGPMPDLSLTPSPFDRGFGGSGY